MAEYLNRDQIQDSLASFLLFDFDSDGLICLEELGKALRSLGMEVSKEELNDLMLDADEDDAGVIDFYKFLEIVAFRVRQREWIQEYVDMCRTYDRDGNGVISASEFRVVMINSGEKLTDEEVDKMIREANHDGDGDGNVNYEEVIRMMIAK